MLTAQSNVIPWQNVAEPANRARVKEELQKLERESLLASQGSLAVCSALAPDNPNIMHELGRLREETFRKVGEGTGKPIDLDEYDEYYTHLILWDRKTHDIVGGYRFARTDEVIATRGAGGLYTSSLVDLAPEFFEQVSPALELGRSFVRSEYQRSYAALLLLWKAIGQWVIAHPRYYRLFGMVSIGDSYSDEMRHVICRTLTELISEPTMSALVTPRTSPDYYKQPLEDVPESLEALGARLTAMAGSAMDIPVLLKHYIKLGGRVLTFNEDASFGNCLDVMLYADLRETDPRLLRRYMGEEGLARFVAAGWQQ